MRTNIDQNVWHRKASWHQAIMWLNVYLWNGVQYINFSNILVNIFIFCIQHFFLIIFLFVSLSTYLERHVISSCFLRGWYNSKSLVFNSLWPRHAIWWIWSTLVQACYLTSPSHYLNQCWLIISEVLWHSPEGNFTGNTWKISILDTSLKLTVVAAASPCGQWVNKLSVSDFCGRLTSIAQKYWEYVHKCPISDTFCQ